MPKGRESGMPPEEQWSNYFNPPCILEQLDCTDSCGDVIEFGCGYGLFTVAAARIVRGAVYGLDIDPEMVLATRVKAAQLGLGNVVVEERDFLSQGCGRPDDGADYAMLFNILHIENPVELLREVHRALRPGGKLGVIHWQHDVTTPRGPSLAIRPRPEQCCQWAAAARFRLVREEPLFCCRYHYGLVFEKPGQKMAL